MNEGSELGSGPSALSDRLWGIVAKGGQAVQAHPILTHVPDQRHLTLMFEDLSEETEERWCGEQRKRVIAYLITQGVNAPTVGEWPAWHIAPIIAVWAVESKSRPDWIGWWAISGDVPTDYTTCRGQRHPREALRDIGERWNKAAAAWSRGESHEIISLGSADRQHELEPLLKARARLLIDWAADDAIWLD